MAHRSLHEPAKRELLAGIRDKCGTIKEITVAPKMSPIFRSTAVSIECTRAVPLDGKEVDVGSFECTTEEHDQRSLHVISLEGDLDMYSAPHLKELLDEPIAEADSSIILDCTQLVFVDSSGLGALVGVLKDVSNNNGQLSLAGVNENIQRILQVTGLGRLFTIYPTLAEAREASILMVA
jgi:anti-sigma B factor antagonist